jgi:TetR/AcrR family transcriptional regulator, cholesterol catabolism regulator
VKNYLTMDTRERILVRAGELFPVMGIRNVTMDQIASDLGISKRTIYENFRDKDELVIEMVEYDMLKNNRKMLVIVAETDNAIEALFSIIEREFNRTSSFNPVFMEDIKKYLHRIHECFFEDLHKMREFSVSYAILEKGLREDIFRKELAIDVVDNFLHELVRVFHNSERFKLMNLSKTDILRNILLPYFRGICTRKGQDLIDTYFEKITI